MRTNSGVLTNSSIVLCQVDFSAAKIEPTLGKKKKKKLRSANARNYNRKARVRDLHQ